MAPPIWRGQMAVHLWPRAEVVGRRCHKRGSPLRFGPSFVQHPPGTVNSGLTTPKDFPENSGKDHDRHCQGNSVECGRTGVWGRSVRDLPPDFPTGWKKFPQLLTRAHRPGSARSIEALFMERCLQIDNSGATIQVTEQGAREPAEQEGEPTGRKANPTSRRRPEHSVEGFSIEGCGRSCEASDRYSPGLFCCWRVTSTSCVSVLHRSTPGCSAVY